MRYDPKAATACLPAGTYAAVITTAEETVSKSSGKEMLAFTYTIYADTGNRQVKDYFTEASLWRLKSLAKAIGKMEEFESGVFSRRTYEGENFIAELVIEENDQFGDQNKVKRYHPADKVQPPAGRSAPRQQAAASGRPAPATPPRSAEDEFNALASDGPADGRIPF